MQISNYDFIREGWHLSRWWSLKRHLIAIVSIVLFWLLGSFLAFHTVGTLLEYENQIARGIMAFIMGPMGYAWTFLEWTGLIVETDGNPSSLWMVMFTLHLGLLYGLYLYFTAPVPVEWLQKRDERLERKKQGQLTEEEAGERMGNDWNMVPLALVKSRHNRKERVTVGTEYYNQSHVLVSGPTRSGKGLHLTKTLLTWLDAAIVVDPKGEQYKRTAGFRKKHVGPVYCVPGHRLPLSFLYDLTDPDDVRELHDQLMQPGQDSQRIFADKSLSLFEAAGHYAKAKGLDPIRTLLRAANDDIKVVLKAMESVPAARPHVRKFTNGLSPEQFNTDRFVASAYGTLTTKLYSYQKHIDTIAPQSGRHDILYDWTFHKPTIYITYDLKDLKGAGGVVAAILAGLMRNQMARKRGHKRTLVAIDELAAVNLRNFGTYLSTVGGYGITVLYYIQALAQLTNIYGKAGAEEILSNSAHQLWYSPNEMATARRISDLYGTFNKPTYSYNQTQQAAANGQTGSQRMTITTTVREEPFLSPTEIMALPKDRVLVITERDHQYRFVGQRVNGLEDLGENPIPAPEVPKHAEADGEAMFWWERIEPEFADTDDDVNDAANDLNDSDTSTNGSSSLPRKPLK